MKDFRTCLKGFAPVLKNAGWKILVSILIGQVRIAASLGFVWICKRLVDIATGVCDAPLQANILLMAGIMATQVATNISASWWEHYINLHAKNDERKRVFAHVVKSVWNGREAFHSGDTINRLEDDIRTVVELICSKLPQTVVTICQLVAASIFMLSMAPRLMWVLVILMAVAIVGSRMFFKTMRRITAEIRAKDSEIQGYMQENLQNRPLVLTLIGAGRVLAKLGMLQSELSHSTVQRLNYGAVARGFMNVGILSGYASAFLWGIFGIRDGVVTYGMMTAFLQLVGQIQRPIADIAQHIPEFIQSLTSAERILELEEIPLENEQEDILAGDAPTIEVKDVTFSYPGQTKKVLNHFSHTFEGGSMTVITGPTGAGKSTLIRLILSLLRSESGEILIGGHSAGVGTRCNFMYVPQGNTLMSGSVRDNLLLANENATEEQMKAALHTAVADFVFDLPEALETHCSEKGAGFSEGQAQRIAIARALLHRGGILILDEATSAVDPETERKLLENLSAGYHGKKTILFISHREAVTKVADASLAISDLG